MDSLLAWLMTTQYGPYVLALSSVIGGLVMIASAIVPLTKTPKDDEFLSKVKAVLARFSLFEPKN